MTTRTGHLEHREANMAIHTATRKLAGDGYMMKRCKCGEYYQTKNYHQSRCHTCQQYDKRGRVDNP